jgi:hypothetical protein
MKIKLIIIIVILLTNLVSCATKNISQEDAPPPIPSKKRFSQYKYYFIKPLAIDSELTEEHGNQKAMEIVDNYLYRDFLDVFETLDPYEDYNPKKPGKTLIIAPSIQKMKSVSRGTRAFIGVFAGGSAVVLKVNYTDANTKEIVADPVFYQHANAFGATYSRGGSDLSMLYRISGLAAAYAADNF